MKLVEHEVWSMDGFQVGDRVWFYQAGGERYRGRVLSRDGDRYRVEARGRVVRVRGWVLSVDQSTRPDPGNLTRTPDYTLGERTPLPKQTPERDREYLAWVRQQMCEFCGATQGIEASHHGRHGMGTKASDYGAIPACRECHARWHQKSSPTPLWDAKSPQHRRELLDVIGRQYRERYQMEHELYESR